MCFSFFIPKTPAKAIFLDFDDTLARPARDANGEFIVEADGYIDAAPLDLEKFSQLVRCAIKNDIPLYIVTGRPAIIRCKNLINKLIESVDGFSESIGGFHRDSILYLSIMMEVEGKLVRKEIDTKINIIQTVHQQKHACLARADILFIEDLDVYLDPVKALGYQTIKADPVKLEHFALAENFMTAPAITAAISSQCERLV